MEQTTKNNRPFILRLRIGKWDEYYLQPDGTWKPYGEGRDSAAAFAKREDLYDFGRNFYGTHGKPGTINAVRRW